MANSRLMNQTLSPSVRSRLKYKRKATRESMENENLLASVKEKFNKVVHEYSCVFINVALLKYLQLISFHFKWFFPQATDRTLANPVIEPKTPFEQILDAIKNGTARKKLKPSCEDMPNQIWIFNQIFNVPIFSLKCSYHMIHVHIAI